MPGYWSQSCRDRFTLADFEFIAEILDPGDQRAHLAKLWEDSDALRQILDLKEVLMAILESPSAILVSPALYFYVLVRHAFLQANLTDVDVADYVAGVMVKQLKPGTGDPSRNRDPGFTHASDFIAVISSARGSMRFHLQVAAGNQFLILTGLYPGFLKQRCERRGAPTIEFYESFARQAFRGAADNPQAPPDAPRRLLGTLSEVLPEARRSLNRIAEEFVFLGE